MNQRYWTDDRRSTPSWKGGHNVSTIMTPTGAGVVAEGTRREPSELSASRDVARIRSEYIEMPGLALTLPQAARLWGLSARRSADLLSILVDCGFLVCS